MIPRHEGEAQLQTMILRMLLMSRIVVCELLVRSDVCSAIISKPDGPTRNPQFGSQL
jgi:hypothetical protein